MGETIHVRRVVGGAPVLATVIVYSPDDGGFYLSTYDFEKKRKRMSKKIYRTRDAAMRDYRDKTAKWEPWY